MWFGCFLTKHPLPLHPRFNTTGEAMCDPIVKGCRPQPTHGSTLLAKPCAIRGWPYWPANLETVMDLISCGSGRKGRA